MFQRFRFSMLTVMAFALVVGFSTDAAAQDCALECRICNGDGREGVGYNRNGGYDMRCVDSNLCKVCGEEEEEKTLVADAGPSEASILRTLSVARPDDLAAVAAKYHDRIFLHASRQLLAIRGEGCQEEYITTVAFVSSDRTAALEQFGIRSLEDFYRDANANSSG